MWVGDIGDIGGTTQHLISDQECRMLIETRVAALPSSQAACFPPSQGHYTMSLPKPSH